MVRYAMHLSAVATLLLLAAAAGCGDADPATSDPDRPATIELQREGGIAGVSEGWIIEADGTLRTPAGDVVGEVAEPAALFEAVEQIGFYDLDGEYLPADPCCDRFTYRLTVEDGDRSHTVETMDGVEDAPPGLFDLIDDVLAAVGS